MSITLGGIALPDLVFREDFGWTGVEGTMERTLRGRPVVFEISVSGRAVDLVGEENTGWVARSTLESLVALASVPGMTYTLSYEGTSYTVRFRSEDAPPIEASPLVARPNPDDEDWYNNVVLKLMIL